MPHPACDQAQQSMHDESQDASPVLRFIVAAGNTSPFRAGIFLSPTALSKLSFAIPQARCASVVIHLTGEKPAR